MMCYGSLDQSCMQGLNQGSDSRDEKVIFLSRNFRDRQTDIVAYRGGVFSQWPQSRDKKNISLFRKLSQTDQPIWFIINRFNISYYILYFNCCTYLWGRYVCNHVCEGWARLQGGRWIWRKERKDEILQDLQNFK